jgi:hypothetical protein
MMRRNRPERAAPTLLVAFFVATVGMVIAVAVLVQASSDWADFVAIALLIAVATLVLAVIARELREQDTPTEDDQPDAS